MSVGTSFGDSCYPTQLEAASAWCSAFSASANGVLYSCNQVTTGASSTLGGAVKFNWQKRAFDLATNNSVSSTVSNQALQACETYDFEYWSPAVAAFASALVAVAAVVAVHRFIFSGRETL